MPRSAPHHSAASAPRDPSEPRDVPGKSLRPGAEEISARVETLLLLRRRSAALYGSTILALERIAAEDDDAELAGFRAREFPQWDLEDIQSLLADLYARESLDDTFDGIAA